MPKNYRRDIFQKIEPYLLTSQAVVITGIRRCGKTYLLKYIYNQIRSDNKLFLDLENPLIRRVFEEKNYETIKTNLERQGLNFSQKTFLFLDEIQLCQTIPSVVKYFIDHYQTKFFLTGSASFYLKNLFTESLSSRKLVFEIFPLSFNEFLRFKETKVSPPKMGEKANLTTWELINPFWQEYLTYGSFPEIVLAQTRSLKEKLLGEIFTSYFQMEIEQLSDFRKINLIRDFILLLAENVGNPLNVQRMSVELGVSRVTLEEWLSFLQATYLVGLVPHYAKKQRVAIRKSQKVYFVDWGLAGKITQISTGQRLENCIYHQLQFKGKVSFFQKKSGAEIDFILNKEHGFEVKSHASNSDKYKLQKLAQELKLKDFYVISGKYSPTPKCIPGFGLN